MLGSKDDTTLMNIQSQITVSNIKYFVIVDDCLCYTSKIKANYICWDLIFKT